MAPTKFEKHIKDKLEKRSIQPSDNAWNRLESRLDTSTKQHNTKPWLWIGVAASIVGVFLVVSQFFNQSKTETIAPTIVVTPHATKQEESTKVVLEKKQEINKVEITKQQDSKLQPKQIIVKTKVNLIAKDEQPITSTTQVVPKKDSDSKANNIKPIELNQEALSFEDQKIQDVVAQVQSLKNRNNTVTDAEIEALLQQAQKEIRLKQLYNENTGIVDARLLLDDVEQELDQSFRGKSI